MPVLKLEWELPATRSWPNHREFLLRYIQMMRAGPLLFFEQKEAEGKTLQALVVEEVSPDRSRAVPSGGIAEALAAGKSIWGHQGRKGV